MEDDRGCCHGAGMEGAKRPLTIAAGLKKASAGAAVVHDAGGHDEEHLPVLKYKKQTIRRDSKL